MHLSTAKEFFFPAVISFHLAGGFQVSSPFQNFISLFEDVC